MRSLLASAGCPLRRINRQHLDVRPSQTVDLDVSQSRCCVALLVGRELHHGDAFWQELGPELVADVDYSGHAVSRMRLDGAYVADPPEIGPDGRARIVDLLMELRRRLAGLMRRHEPAGQTPLARESPRPERTAHRHVPTQAASANMRRISLFLPALGIPHTSSIRSTCSRPRVARPVHPSSWAHTPGRG